MKRIGAIIAMMLLMTAFVAHAAVKDIDSYIPVNDVQDPNTFVVIISNENYKYEETVPFALNDGSTFKLYCEKALGIPEKNIKYVPNASLNDMKYFLTWLENVMRAYNGEARAIFYYSGHGMPDETNRQAFLLPVDGHSIMPESGLSTETLYARLGAMQSAATMVFLDACFSGASRDGGMMQSSRGVAIAPKKHSVSGNVVVFSATKGNETAYPYKDKRHGMFTYFILEQLQTKKGYVTLGELSDYVCQQVSRKSIVDNNKSQTPTVTSAIGNNIWRNWKLANKPASKFTTINVTTPAIRVTPTPQFTPQPVKPQPSTTPQQNYTLRDNDATLSLVAMGKKSMRALNYQQAYKYFKQATSQNSLEGYYQMGLLYIDNNYSGYNKDTAIDYFSKASSCGHVDATYQLGMQWLGTDNTQARKYLRQAAAKGHQQARTQLDHMR
ncbi:MAG: caspase family protein [Prevotella sp.]|nr:caspase family protein [Prevotella sp.]